MAKPMSSNIQQLSKGYEQYGRFSRTRRGSLVDRRPSTAEAPPIGKINPFSKMAVTFEPLIGF